MMQKTYFITSSGTGIGKTLVTAALGYQFRQAGEGVALFKPLISGFDAENPQESDTAILAEALGQPLDAAAIEHISPFRFAAPLSPDMAARREGRALTLESLVAATRGRLRTSDAAWNLIEGVGGVMVPLNDRHTVLDWITALNIPAILVTGSYLGALSHTLTACQSLTQAGVKVALVIVSESESPPVPLEETLQTLRHFLPVPLAGIPRILGPRPWERAPDMLPLLKERDAGQRA